MLLILVVLGLLASAVIIYATPWGPWAYSDSAAYLATARNLASGEGFHVLKPSGEQAVLMPPLYPIILAGLHKIGFSLVEAARWLDVLLFGLMAVLAGLIVLRLGNSPGLAIPAVILLLSFPVMLRLFSGTMSEPPFLVLSISGLFLLGVYLINRSRAWLVGAAVACALATLARFIGIALLPAALLAILLLQHVSLKQRLSDLTLFCLIYAIPTLIWALWYSQNAPAPVQITQWSDPWEYLTPVRAGLVDVLWGWVPFHDSLPLQRYLHRLVALCLLAAGVFGLMILAGFRLHSKDLRMWIEDNDIRLFALCLLFTVIYLFVFIGIYLLRYPPQDVDERTLLPLFPFLILMIFSLFSLLQRAYSGRSSGVWLKFLPWFALAVGLTAFLPDGLALIAGYHQSGEGYTGAAWRSSETAKAVQVLPSHIPIISNDTGAILYFTGQMAIGIGERYRTETIDHFTRYGDDPADSAEELFREGEAALVLFYPSFYWQLHELYPDETDAHLEAFLKDLNVFVEYPDGGIYFYPTKE